ncbi:hypothetical protein QJS04_geneDACA012080 [Acorus gramineus]|uniref:Uncharacterized protein n=1 Tax=Acorus gramineus TaxID=55184 RepID=A0AAV9BC49_ACOGR|nr:hypothetical protein QJS04_geneDACA012080 [Acorus gramineus]
MATTFPWHPLSVHPSIPHHRPSPIQRLSTRHVVSVRAFQRSDFDGFAKRVASGEALRDAWRSANDGFEQLVFDARRASDRLDSRYSISRRLKSAARSAGDKARELDRDLGIGRRWRTFSVDFYRNWPRYRKELKGFTDTPLGKGLVTTFFLWFALSGWWFNFLIFATCVLPFAAPLLIGTIANNFVIEGTCPACKRQFMGYRNQIIQCAGCRNIVWQPGDGGGGNPPSNSGPDIIDVEFEEK